MVGGPHYPAGVPRPGFAGAELDFTHQEWLLTRCWSRGTLMSKKEGRRTIQKMQRVLFSITNH